MAIIRYYEKARFVANEVGWVYEYTTDPNKKGKRISKDKAKAIIKEEGLVLVHQNKFGCIWDTPDKEFRKRFERK